LTPYFLNDEYPGLRDSFSATYLASNELGYGKNYGIPYSESFGWAGFRYIRGDLRDKYNIPPVTDEAGFLTYLQTIKENEPNMIPWGAAFEGGGFDWYWSELNSRDFIEHFNDNIIKGAGIWRQLWADVAIDDKYQIQAVALRCEPDSAWADFPEPWNHRDTRCEEFAADYAAMGFYDPDIRTSEDGSAGFKAGRDASIYGDTPNYMSTLNAVQANVPEARLEIYMSNPIWRDYIKGQTYGQYTVGNFQCIPVSTPQDKADRIMMFFDWLFSSRENHDLFAYGIEGEHWQAVGDDMMKIPDGVDPATNYYFPGYQLTWNPNYVRVSSDLPDDALKFTKMGYDPDMYYKYILDGWNFDNTSVETECLNPDLIELMDEWRAFRMGLPADKSFEENLAHLDKVYADNKNMQEDVAILKEEFTKQFQAFLDQRYIEDQASGIVYPK